MKKTTPFTLISAIFVMIALAPATPAVASGISIHIGGHGHYGGHHYKRRHYGHRRHGHHRRHHYKRGYAARHSYGSHSGHGRHCKPVHKFVPDGYGGGTKIGGTMCYDHYGNGYVVPGSRYIIADY